MTLSTFGRYQIEAELGRGAMGTVYRAVDPLLERTVAIKTLNPDLPGDTLAEVKARFLREARSAGKLNHPNVVTIYDVGEADGIAYIAMEFLDGRSLREVLDANTMLPIYTIADIAAQIADALDYAQRNGIVHRDVKPANIMISRMGHAKLADFGLAYVQSSTMTQVGTVLGTPKYLSPEQVLGQPVDGRADIFGLGVVLFEMLTRKTPFERPHMTVASLLQNIVTEPAPSAVALNREIPAAFDSILARALAKRPEDRYQRGGDFANDLRNYKRLSGPEADLTMIAPRGVQPAAVTSAPLAPEIPAGSGPVRADSISQEDVSQLLQDVEAFSRNLDAEQARQRAEYEAREKAAAEAARAAAEARAAAASQTRAQAATPAAKSGLIGMLRGQRQQKVESIQQSDEQSLESAWILDAKLRQVFSFLLELVREFNAVTPVYSGRLNLIFVGALPALTLKDGFCDYRTRKFDRKDVIDHVSLAYQMSADVEHRASLNRDDARLLRAHLERARIAFTECEQRDAQTGMPRVGFSIPCTVQASATVRADYDAGSALFQCQNVGLLGLARYRLAAAEINDDSIEEFGKLILGLPNRFAGFRRLDELR